MSQRRFLVGGNWKCNGTRDLIKARVAELNSLKLPSTTDVVVAPTLLHIDAVRQLLQRPEISVAAQDCYLETGAFTGEVSEEMLQKDGILWVILGYSECRAKFGESDDFVG
eukprot:EC720032.1.p1 GENE.EC720032.1~~EC720032.1.p1  ORF type:complete len:125 (+),score=3.92 EC720032.1:44-376(+)